MGQGTGAAGSGVGSSVDHFRTAGGAVLLADANGAFATVRSERPDLWQDLFVEDELHPSPLGSFLAACSILVAVGRYLGPPSGPKAPNGGAASDGGSRGGGGGSCGDFHGSPLDDAGSLFCRARRPLSEGQPSDRLPTADEMAYLWRTAEITSGHSAGVGPEMEAKTMAALERLAEKEANQRSLCNLEIKPWEADQDLSALYAKIKETVVMDGLKWSENFALVDVAFGVQKIVCTAVIPLSLSMDAIIEEITEESFAGEVQSMTMTSMSLL